MDASFVHARLVILATVLAASGCASSPGAEPPVRGGTLPQRVVLVEEPMVRDLALLRKQFAAALPADSAQATSAVDVAVEAAEARALGRMRVLLSREPEIDVVDASAARAGDARLRFRITDYGSTPKAWRDGYIAFEVTSTLAIAGLAYAYPATRPIAGVYLVQEGAEETAEGYAGFWALDEVCRPVRIEAQLAVEGEAPIWKGSATGLSRVVLGRLVREVRPAEQEAQRGEAMDEALGKLVSEIAHQLAQRASQGALSSGFVPEFAGVRP